MNQRVTNQERDQALRLRDRWCSSVRTQLSGSAVLVAMSGGVDSSVAASLLSNAGLRVIGIHFRLQPEGVPATAKGCCHTGSANDVAAVCDTIGATSQVWNLSNVFDTEVIKYFEHSYLTGETPNPCVECNRSLKWGVLWERRNLLGIDFIATGHYARKISLAKKSWFGRGLDKSKDQAYALWPVPEERIARTLLPLGIFHKKQIRILAKEEKLPTADTPESQDICFLGSTDYRDWLVSKHPGTVASGKIKSVTGDIVGSHSGVTSYTVGQRKGLGGGYTEPQYVVDTNIATAEVTIGSRKQLLKQAIIIRDVVGTPVNEILTVQIRYRDHGLPAKLEVLNDNRIKIVFQEPAWAPAKGQSAVAFQGDRLILGGVIDEIL